MVSFDAINAKASCVKPQAAHDEVMLACWVMYHNDAAVQYIMPTVSMP